MSLRENWSRTRHRTLLASSAAVILAAGTTAGVLAGTAGSASHPAAKHPALAAGTTGSRAAPPADAGWDGFSAINPANCSIVQTYNVGDPPVPGDAGDQNYSSTDEAVALSGHTLYFADTGNDSVAVIDAATLNPKNYNPAETDIHVGFNPDDLAATPGGSPVWGAR